MTGTLGGKDLHLDVLAGYPRDLGIEIAVRSLAAEVVLCDEIGSVSDAEAILAAANCGVPIVATAHARTVKEILLRPPLRRLHDARIFSAYAGLSRTGASDLRVSLTDWCEAENLGRSL
jgi:stage III sporulation protein AA